MCEVLLVLVAESCSTLCDAMDGSPPGSSVRGISQTRNWGALPFPSQGYLPGPGIKTMSPALAGGFFFLTTKPPGKPLKLLG